MKRGAPYHPKVKALERLLGIEWYAAVGLWEILLHWTAKYAPAGDVGKYTDAEIAENCGWTGAPDVFVGALVDARMVDARDDVRLFVHDWPDHAEDAVHIAMARAPRLFADGNIPKTGRLGKDEKKRLEPKLQELRAAWERAHQERTTRARRAHKKRPASASAYALASASAVASEQSPAKPGDSAPPDPQMELPELKPDRPELPAEATELATLLRDRILEQDPGARVPPKLDGWARTLDLMNRIDKRSWDEIRAGIDWLFTTNARSEKARFVVLSAEALRGKFDRMRHVARNDQTTRSSHGTPNRHDPAAAARERLRRRQAERTQGAV